MTDPAQTFWPQTFLVLVVVGVGIWLHLKWHPLRAHFVEAWRLLQAFKWMVPLLAALHLLSLEGGPWYVPDSSGLVGQITPWQQMLALFPLAVREVVILMHGLFPPEMLTLFAPILFSAAVYRLTRYPHRYGQLRLSQKAKGLLVAMFLGVLGWVMLASVSIAVTLPPWLAALKDAGRWLMAAWAMTVCQVFMVRLVVNWKSAPGLETRQDFHKALHQTLAHWRGALALTLLNLLWILAWTATADHPQHWTGWVITEAGFVLAVAPWVIARFQGGWSRLAAVMMRGFLDSWLPLLGFVLTASFLLILVHVSMRGLFSLLPETTAWSAMIRILFALVLATVRSWLFLTFVLTLLHHGLKAAAPRESVN